MSKLRMNNNPSRQIRHLKNEVTALREYIACFAEFVGYEGKPYVSIIPGDPIKTNHHCGYGEKIALGDQDIHK